MPVSPEPTVSTSEMFVHLIRMPKTGVFPEVHFSAPPADGRYEVGALIVDHRVGISHLITVDKKGVLTSRFDAPMRRTISMAEAERMTDAELAARATAFLRRRADWIAALELPKAETAKRIDAGLIHYGEVEERESRPTLATFAAEALLARSAGVPLAEWFSHERGHPWGISERTVVRWIARCRDAGLLSVEDFPRKQGRPRITPTAASAAESE
ncbi:MAG: hypothetical protein QM607_09860 [Microbacterium sp.]